MKSFTNQLARTSAEKEKLGAWEAEGRELIEETNHVKRKCNNLFSDNNNPGGQDYKELNEQLDLITTKKDHHQQRDPRKLNQKST